MAFGQAAGPPASGKQVQELLALLQRAGHTDFRDARGPMGLTQRQGGGKFTRDEAQGLIDQLLEAEHASDDGGSPGSSPPAAAAPVTRAERQEAEQIRALRAMRDELLADELARRGWAVIAP